MNQRELEALMRRYGFWILRIGKHQVWTNGSARVVAAKSPSCWRALKNIERDLRRATRKETA